MSNKRTDRQPDSFRAPQTDSYRAPQCGVVIRLNTTEIITTVNYLTYIVKPKLKPLHFERNENDAACL